MRGRVRAIVAAVAATALAVVALPARAAVPGSFCFIPQGIVGVGSTTQVDVINGLFVTAYRDVCPRSAGLVQYQGIGDNGALTEAFKRFPPITFYGSDVPLTALEKQEVENDTNQVRGRISLINQIPDLVDGFAVAYNLSSCGITAPIKLGVKNLALIYSGVITTWNQQLLVRDNPELANCNRAIKVAVRSDTAGPTSIFKDYLSKGLPAFAALNQKDDLINRTWPPTLAVSCAGTGEAGMASCIGDPGAIGYVEYRVAHDNGLPVAQLDNASGAFTLPAADLVNQRWPSNCEAAAAATTVPTTTSDWSTVSLTYPTSGYALCSFTYLWAFQKMFPAYFGQLSPGQVRNTVDFLTTLLSDNVQNQLPSYGYAPLPPNVRDTGRQGVAAIDCGC